MVHGPWSTVHRPRSIVHGPSSMVGPSSRLQRPVTTLDPGPWTDPGPLTMDHGPDGAHALRSPHRLLLVACGHFVARGGEGLTLDVDHLAGGLHLTVRVCDSADRDSVEALGFDR